MASFVIRLYAQHRAIHHYEAADNVLEHPVLQIFLGRRAAVVALLVDVHLLPFWGDERLLQRVLLIILILFANAATQQRIWPIWRG
jgi:hypothetical protein